MKQGLVVASRTEKVVIFSHGGLTDVLYEYDPAVVSMEEVNATIDRLEKENGGRAFSMSNGEQVDKVTTQTRDIAIIKPLAGG